MKLVAVNSLGNMIGLNFPLVFGVTTQELEHGIYGIDREDDELMFVREEYLPEVMDEESYQFPLPVFGA